MLRHREVGDPTAWASLQAERADVVALVVMSALAYQYDLQWRSAGKEARMAIVGRRD